MLGYFSEFDIPNFSLGGSTNFKFDHIELAGRVRDKIFHGGGLLSHDEVPAKLKIGVELLNLRPDMISHVLRRDCEQEIAKWATQEGRAWRAQNGEDYDMPTPNPEYDGSDLIQTNVISASPMGSQIQSFLSKSTTRDT